MYGAGSAHGTDRGQHLCSVLRIHVSLFGLTYAKTFSYHAARSSFDGPRFAAPIGHVSHSRRHTNRGVEDDCDQEQA